MGRATVNRVVQVGVESVPGTPVAASKLLPSVSIDIGPRLTSKQYRAAGYKYNTVSRIHQQWGEGAISGPLDYNQILWLLASLIHAPTPTTPGGGVLTREWVFNPNANSADVFKALTVESGDADAAQQSSYSVVRSLDLEWGLDDVTVSGNMISRKPTTVALTGSPTSIAQMPVSAREIDVYMDTTFAGIGTTKITDALSARLSIGNKFNPKWILNTANQSFKELVEVPVDLSFRFETEHNAQSRALFDDLTNNPTKYMRVKATGPIIEGALTYLFQTDIAVNISGTEQTDVEGVWGYAYECSPKHDATMGRPFQITTRNVITAL